jgi:hypothetical protein
LEFDIHWFGSAYNYVADGTGNGIAKELPTIMKLLAQTVHHYLSYLIQ